MECTEQVTVRGLCTDHGTDWNGCIGLERTSLQSHKLERILPQTPKYPPTHTLLTSNNAAGTRYALINWGILCVLAN